MYSSEDFKRFYFEYQSEALPHGESIQSFCLKNKVLYMQRIYMRDKSRRIMNEECRSEEPVAIRMSPYDVRRKRTDFRPFSLNGEKEKDE